MSKTTPAVIVKSEFINPSKQGKYSGYINYMDRDEAKENMEFKSKSHNDFYHKYMSYMGDNEKNGVLFNDVTDELSIRQQKEMAMLFSEAEDNESPMWKDVISFDNNWLQEQGLYDEKTHWLNEHKMKSIVRKAMNTMIDKEKMQSPIWTASFHYNTENIHVHIATVELDPSYLSKVHAKDRKTKEQLYNDVGEPIMQYRGKRKQASLDAIKSTVANQVYDRTASFQKIDSLIRDNSKRIQIFDLRHNKVLQELYQDAFERLPESLTEWRYGYQSVDEARPYIDDITTIYLKTYHEEEFNDFIDQLDEQVEINEKLYGTDSRYDEYKEHKIDDLYKRMGNAILTQMREHEQEPTKERKKNVKPVRNGKYAYNFLALNKRNDFNDAIYQMKQALRKTFHEYEVDRNIGEFDRMLEGYEY